MTSIRYQYNPVLANHCFFEATLAALGMRCNMEAVKDLRAHLADLWVQDNKELGKTAEMEGMTAEQYVRALREDL